MATYPLMRTYSITSLIGIALVTLVLAFFYRANAIKSLQEMETNSNEAIASLLARSIWDEYGDFLENAGRLTGDELRTHPTTAKLYHALTEKLADRRIVKIKIYDLQGITVFSTDNSQIGEPKHDNAGFQAALRGITVSDITYRDQFNAFDKVIEDRSLLFSYIPVRLGSTENIAAVFELYSDLTPLLDAIDHTEYTVIMVVVGVMLLLFVFLLVIVRRADLLIKQHESNEWDLQQERMRYLAKHDQLTGLPNRDMLLDLLTNAVERSRRTGKGLALLLLDIDRFKLINDHIGQQAGDKLLLELVSRVADVVGEQRVVSRLGGDKFVVVLEAMQADTVDTTVSRLINAVSRPYHLEGTETNTTISVGIASLQADTPDASHLLKNAEAAMQQAKSQGHKRYAYFTADMEARSTERYKLEAGLHQALSNDEFSLNFQPRIDSQSGRLLAAEALLRWQPPNGEAIGPAQFVPVLEDMGLIIPVGAWVLKQACAHCKAWHVQGHPELKVSVNLSMQQFQAETLMHDIVQALEESELPAHALELELTETMLAQDPSATARTIQSLKALGVHLSIDDFGTGYSSLSYLMHYPIDFLKIDRAFIQDATSNPNHATLTRTIVSMAKSLDLRTVAEGVETIEQRDFLIKLGCGQLQGFLYSKPLPAREFAEYIRQSAAP